MGKPEGKKPLGRPNSWLVDNVWIDFGEIGRGGVDFIGLTQDRDTWKTCG
jgi:hypothetical protein